MSYGHWYPLAFHRSHWHDTHWIGEADTVPSVPGLEYSLRVRRIHYRNPTRRIHATLPTRRIHYRIADK